MHGSLVPLGRRVAAELSAKMNTDITLSFNRIMASDIQGKARAFRALVGANIPGLAVQQAGEVAGLVEDGEQIIQGELPDRSEPESPAPTESETS